MNLDIINVSNGNSQYPGNFTRKEKEKMYLYSKGKILNLFSGKSYIGNVRVDFSCKEATHNIDVFEFLEQNTEHFDTVIIDAPYSSRFGDKYQKIGNTDKQFIIFANTKDTTRLFTLIKEKLNPEIIILKSWNYYIPKGYKLIKGFLCYPGGYRKSTILEILANNLKDRELHNGG